MDKIVHINIEAMPKASQRTKNRLRENGPVFRVKKAEKAQCMGGRVAFLLTAPNGWHGWLPMEEVKFSAIDVA